MGDWIYWLSWSLSIAIVCSMIYVAWWALFHDRPNGRRRCPKCWYDLSYAPPPGMTCPECGHTARRERQLTKTRRRYGTAVVAMLTVVAVAAFAQDRMGRFGWSATMPTRVLVLSLPYVEPHSMIYQELIGRAEKNALTDGQWAALMRRCARGDVTASPTDEAWRRKYGRFILQTRRALAPAFDADAPGTYRPGEAPLMTLPPVLELSAATRPSNAEETIWTMLTLTEWWPHRSQVRLVLTPMLEDSESRSAAVRYAGHGRRENVAAAVPLSPIPGELMNVPVAVDAFHRREDRGEWSYVGRTYHMIEVSEDASEAGEREAIDDEHVEELLRSIFRGEIIRWSHGPSPVRFAYRPYPSGSPALDGVAIGALVELRQDEEVARRIEMWWLAGTDRAFSPMSPGADGTIHWRVAMESLALLEELDADDDRWRLVVRGDKNVAARVAGATKFWSGELEQPIRVVDRLGEAPPPTVWLE